MRLLVLGGTLFLGRHVVEAALERGHEVTLFNRGRTNPELFPEAEHLRGDRDGDLSALVGREWDAVVDPSGYVPRVVRVSVELLAGAAPHYTFVSSISVYRDFARVGIAGATFNATSVPLPMEGVLAAITSVAGTEARFVKVDEDWLLDQGVEPFQDLPLWLAVPRNPEYCGFFRVDASRAHELGLPPHPVPGAIADTLAWAGEGVDKDYGPSALAHGLDPERERELLAAWATLKS